MISKYYFINKFETNNIDKLDKQTGVIYRNYGDKLDIKDVIKAKKYCLKKKLKFYLSNNYKIALKLNLDGAYIPSFNKDLVLSIILLGKLSRKKIRIERQIKKNKENFCFAPLCKRAERITMPKSSLLEDI